MSSRHPFFDIKNFHEADTKAGKIRLRNQFLADAYQYLVEKDPEAIRTLEEELDQPDWPHWQAWFRKAKKFKKQQMKQTERRIKQRMDAAMAGGLSRAQALKQVNGDTSDSAYESDDEDEGRQQSEMPPPRRPASQRPKTKNYIVAGSKVGSKRRATTTSTGSPALFMRGANGSRTPSTRRSPSIRSDTAGLDNIVDGLEDYEDEIMDIRPPRDSQPPPLLPPHLAGVQGQWGFGLPNTPPSTGRRLGSESARRIDPNGLDDPDEEDRARLQEHNGPNLTEKEAVQQALRASMEPESVRGENVIVSTEADGEDST